MPGRYIDTEPGAIAEHILVKRTGYSHHGLYVGKGVVIHYSGEVGSQDNTEICETTIDLFSKGSVVFRVVYRYSISPLESINNAYSRIGENAYSLLFNNCEHFATWCKTGLHRSKQSEAAQRFILLEGLLIPLTSIPILGFRLMMLMRALQTSTLPFHYLDYAYISDIVVFRHEDFPWDSSWDSSDKVNEWEAKGDDPYISKMAEFRSGDGAWDSRFKEGEWEPKGD